MEDNNLIALTADIVAAHVSNNSVAVSEVGNLIQRVHEALSALGGAALEQTHAKNPVVSIRASVKPDFIVCMECGKKQKTLRRHLQIAHGMTPEQYRRDYGLPDTYPMTSPNYSEKRRSMANAFGLGRKKAAPDGAPGPSKPARRKPPAPKEV